MTRRQEQKRRTRQSLKTAAMQLLQDTATDDLSVAQITRAAGVAGGTFYVHFVSKEALFAELVEDLNALMVRALATTFTTPERGPRKQLQRLAHAYLAFWRQHRNQVGLYRAQLATTSADEIMTRGSQPSLHAALVGALVGAGAADQRQARLAATTIFATWRTTAFVAMCEDDATEDLAAPLLVAATWGVLTSLDARLPTRLHRRLVTMLEGGEPLRSP